MTDITRTGFTHERLDAYHVACELATRAVRLTRTFPRGFAELRDQIQRAALATVRHIAEGANRETAADKRSRFVIARGECAECDASLECARLLGFAAAPEIEHLRTLSDRVGAMLSGLIRRYSSSS